MRNVARDRAASTIMAALFLQHFVKDTPWAHLDMAAPSHSDRDEGWLSRGNTGWGRARCSTWPPPGPGSQGKVR